MVKEQNEEIMARNKEIQTKLTCIEDDNRELKQELQDIKSSLKHKDNGNSLSSRKRNQSEDESEHNNEHSNNKKAKVSSVANLPNPDPPASFDSLDDDCLGNVLDFVGKKCYSAFGRVNKRCNEMFCSKGLPKVTYLFGYGSLHLVQQRRGYNSKKIVNAVLHYDRRDILDWILTDESDDGWDWRLKYLCDDAIEESRLDILCEVFQRGSYEQQLAYLRDCGNGFSLCTRAARHGNLECLKLLRENECEWSRWTWDWAKDNGHEHILQYLRNNGYPTEWQN